MCIFMSFFFPLSKWLPNISPWPESMSGRTRTLAANFFRYWWIDGRPSVHFKGRRWTVSGDLCPAAIKIIHNWEKKSDCKKTWIPWDHIAKREHISILILCSMHHLMFVYATTMILFISFAGIWYDFGDAISWYYRIKNELHTVCLSGFLFKQFT